MQSNAPGGLRLKRVRLKSCFAYCPGREQECVDRGRQGDLALMYLASELLAVIKPRGRRAGSRFDPSVYN